MLINTHVHTSRYGVDFAPELGDYFVSVFQGNNCWYTGEPWKAEDFCVTSDQLISDMDGAGIDKGYILGIASKFGNSYDQNAAEYVAEMVEDHLDRPIGFYTPIRSGASLKSSFPANT